jgi:hypothetical protein
MQSQRTPTLMFVPSMVRAGWSTSGKITSQRFRSCQPEVLFPLTVSFEEDDRHLSAVS